MNPFWIVCQLFISLIAGALVQYYPQRGAMRVSPRKLALVYGIVFVFQCLAFALIGLRGNATYQQLQGYMLFIGGVNFLFPFFLIRDRFYQCLFLVTVATNGGMVAVGLANYIEIVHGGQLAARSPGFLTFAVLVVIYLLAVPPLLLFLERLLHKWITPGNVHIWRVIWTIPMVMFILGLISGNIFMLSGMNPPWMYLFALAGDGAGMILILYILGKSLRQGSHSAAVAGSARIIDQQLALLRAQYAVMAENAAVTRDTREKLRSHLKELRALAEAGQLEAITSSLENYAAAIPLPNLEHCDNGAANAILHHYAMGAKDAGIPFQIEAAIPAQIGQVSDVDLCVVISNCLENAMEACEEVPPEARHIHFRAKLQGDYLVMTIDNSYAGSVRKAKGRLQSTKHEGEGIGTLSVHHVAERYGGRAAFDVCNEVFQASVVLNLCLSRKFAGERRAFS